MEDSLETKDSRDSARAVPGGERGAGFLRQFFRFFDRPDLTLHEILERVVQVIPKGFRHPERTGVRILVGGRSYLAGDFDQTSLCLKEEVVFGGESVGTVEVSLGGVEAADGREPFLGEERELMGIIAEGLGRLVGRKEMEEALRWEAEQNSALAELSRALITAGDIEEVSWLVLEHAKRMTGSRYGYVAYIDMETGYLVSPTLTRDIWEACTVKDKSVVFKDFRGLWGWVLKNRRPLLTNHPAEDPRSVGVPEGHIPIERFLSVPAIMGGVLVGQVALANSERDYEGKDLELVSRLADLYAVAVMRMWTDKELDNYRARLEELVKKRTLELERSNLRLRREVEERARREKELREMAERLRVLSEHLQSVREEERRRIAREVHDKLGQELTGLKIELSLLARAAGGAPGMSERLSEVSAMVDDIIRTVREISAELRPSVLDDLGLEAALEWQLKRFGEMTGIRCRLEAEVEEGRVDPETEVTLFRIAQEALTNVARHAEASEVEVRLFSVGREMVLQVKDNGRGVRREDLDGPEALGILGMRERAAARGGSLEIRGRKGEGTVLEVRVPLGSAAATGDH